MYRIEESTFDIVGTIRHPPQSFGSPIVIRCPVNCAPYYPSRYAPTWYYWNWGRFATRTWRTRARNQIL